MQKAYFLKSHKELRQQTDIGQHIDGKVWGELVAFEVLNRLEGNLGFSTNVCKD